MPELKIYTVKDLQEWLTNNHPAEGLSERVIAPTRAWAIIHNPYVRDNDAIVAAIFEDGELAAYTSSFPDMLDGQRVWWCSTLYCYPQFAGRGYGMIVVGSLMEAHEPDLTYDRWGASETVEIFKHFGYQTTYTTRYHLTDGMINKSSFKGKLAYCVQELKKCLHPWPKQSKANYSLRYASYIDGETYAFMKAHKGDDLWLREQNMFNWIVRYPFIQGCPILKKVEQSEVFKSFVSSYQYIIAKVYSNVNIVGCYIMRAASDALAVLCLYYTDDSRDLVFTSIADHIISFNPKSFTTESDELLSYIQKDFYFPKMIEEEVSFSVPPGIFLPDSFAMQLADGDSFA